MTYKYFVPQGASECRQVAYDSTTIIPIVNSRPLGNVDSTMMIRFYHIGVPSNSYMREKIWKGWEIQAAVPNLDGKCFGKYTYGIFTPAYGLIRGCTVGKDDRDRLDNLLPSFLRALKNQYAVTHWIWDTELYSEYETDFDTGKFNPGSKYNGLLGRFDASGIFQFAEPKTI